MEQRIKQPSNCYCSEMTGVEQMKQEKKIIIGGGPCGLSAAIAFKQIGIDALVIEKGNVVNSIYHYPTHQTFFLVQVKSLKSVMLLLLLKTVSPFVFRRFPITERSSDEKNCVCMLLKK
ncbi:hypothetical protein BsIDN1_40030 [Bacillus safensis]|uniref:Uncharacterized protein n=1 Tax=Bacillus safensis TaxID=561879 RepID=A0A5S9MC00_BACIA|nr:hypothetical protein BsIDN1_40030 [Bacillus safensis]